MEYKEYNLKELSKILKTSVYTLRRRIADGRLKANKVLGEYIVTGHDLEEFLMREEVGKVLNYFNKKGDLYKKKCEDIDLFEEEVIYLVEKVKVIGLSDAARIYYERGLYKNKKE